VRWPSLPGRHRRQVPSWAGVGIEAPGGQDGTARDGRVDVFCDGAESHLGVERRIVDDGIFPLDLRVAEEDRNRSAGVVPGVEETDTVGTLPGDPALADGELALVPATRCLAPVRNVGLVARPETRLDGEYEVGQVLKEALSSDKLEDDSSYGVAAFVGPSFRFSKSPFKKAGGGDGT